MADLGAHGTYDKIGRIGIATTQPIFVRCLMVDGKPHFVRVSKDTSEGNPQPSLRMVGPGKFTFMWPVTSGSHSIQVDVKYSPDVVPRPRMTVHADPSIGVNADVSGSASSSAGYVTIGPLTVTPSGTGALKVDLEVLLQQPNATANFDNILAT